MRAFKSNAYLEKLKSLSLDLLLVVKQKRKNKLFVRLLLGLSALLVVMVTAVFAKSQPNALDSAKPADTNSFERPGFLRVVWPPYENAKTDRVIITKNTSQLLRFDRAISRSAISNPAICDITAIGDRDVLVNAKQAGIANLLVWDSSNNVAAYFIESTLDLAGLSNLVSQIDPKATIRLIPFNDSVGVYGTTETSLTLKEINQAAKAFDKNAESFVQLNESKQILLEVRFAEINRKANKDFKLDIEAIGDHFAVRGLTGKTGASTVDSDSTFTPSKSPVTFEPIGLPSEANSNLFGTYVNDSLMISNYLKWLEEQNILKIIARPNLLAKDGEQAKFLVGGEFPVPIATQNFVHIDYKEFGTKLIFTPEILENKVIRLKIETEVSELDFSNAVTFSGITVPSLIKRNHQTVAEMKDNQTFVIAGLLQQKIEKNTSRVPFFSRIPLISALFKSDEYNRTDVELLVAITPHIVKPIELNEKKNLYDAATVKAGMRTYIPPYPDPQGDAIHRLLVQNEKQLTKDDTIDSLEKVNGNKNAKPAAVPPTP